MKVMKNNIKIIENLIQKMILKGEKPYTDRPNAHLEPIDFEKEFKELELRANKTRKFTKEELKEIIETYKQKLKDE